VPLRVIFYSKLCLSFTHKSSRWKPYEVMSILIHPTAETVSHDETRLL
jgi:hypothetical protein